MGRMKRALSSFVLKALGWRVVVTLPDYPKCVICVAPHTSNWDFIIGKLAYLSVGRFAGFMMKKEWFFPPLGALFRSMGGVPVSRDRRTDMVSQLVAIFTLCDCHYPRGYPQAQCRLEEGLLLHCSGGGGSHRAGLYRLQGEAGGYRAHLYPYGRCRGRHAGHQVVLPGVSCPQAREFHNRIVSKFCMSRAGWLVCSAFLYKHD